MLESTSSTRVHSLEDEPFDDTPASFKLQVVFCRQEAGTK
jgi:hypothetical protein